MDFVSHVEPGREIPLRPLMVVGDVVVDGTWGIGEGELSLVMVNGTIAHTLVRERYVFW